ncbi:LysR family transcriptional regulator [Microvirga terricola]|uniref:LysR family transcriptional regulator n=1 Tax=Microvirga terricola TaxID=2719797 RepID=A0ABX0VG28_9HYPH|nr:LysR family transcriptional regulator [Microvirga terricola]NIX77960.1 LysR family transcriptional regulator [Microvirga terricola]
MDNRMGEMLVFIRVVEAGSFSEAARQLRMTPSTVSKAVIRIEERLGARLIERSTRRLKLTEDGRTYYERSLAIATDVDDLEQSLSQGSHKVSGVVRVNTSVPFGVLMVEPLLPGFWEEYPDIVVDLSLSDEVVDLYLERTDVAFRIGTLADSGLVALRIGATKRHIVASPAYLAKHGTPTMIEDLERHNCLGFNFRRTAPVWPLHQAGRIVDRTVRGSLLANNGETVRRLAVAGVGLARLGHFHVAEDLAAGRLVSVLQDAGDAEEIHALHLGTQRSPARIRAFLDYMVPACAKRSARRTDPYCGQILPPWPGKDDPAAIAPA